MDQVTERKAHMPTAAGGRLPQLPGGNRLFAGGGETGARLAAIDWAKTPLGPVETWPQTLRTSLRICLTSRHAMIIWWGPDLTFFFNDAYAPTLGIKLPWAAGKPGREVWSEIWPTIGPMLANVLQTGEPTWSDDELLFLERSGFPEETYHTYSYSPIEDDAGAVVGVFTAVTETTERVLSERRTRLARDLAAALVDARSTEDVCARAARVLGADSSDIPFALLYGLDAHTQQAALLGAAGLAAGTPMSPDVVDLDASATATEADPWSLARVARAKHEASVHEVAWRGAGPDVEPGLVPHEALVLPVIEPGQAAPTALLVAGVSPRRALDGDYHAFYSVLASHLATALAAAHAYEEERRRAEALAELDRAKTAFFSNVSHEFRTPLTLMLGPLEDALADSAAPLPAPQRERLDVMRRSGQRLLKLVNTLLDFARIEAGRVSASFEPTDLADYTADLASSFRSLTEKAGLRLVVDCAPLDGLREPVYVDREMWEKIVLNLLSNAFKFTFAGSITVALSAVDAGGAVELLVRDTGVGVPPEELPRLFERFHRVEGARSRTHEGSGIGLALVQELVHLHGGSIRAESVEGEGTSFIVRLPVGAAHLPADHVRASRQLTSTALGAAAYVQEAERWLPTGSAEGEAPPVVTIGDVPARLSDSLPGAQTARILLADDNADMRDYLRRLLGERYSVEAVANGAAALDAIRRDQARDGGNLPDLVLSDIMMPELDGFGLLRALRADPATATLPVILLSARAGEEATAEGLAAGADDYLVKPFSARELLARVEARLEITRVRAESDRRTREALDALLAMAELLVQADADGEAGQSSGGAGPRAATASRAGQRIVELTRRVLSCDVAAIVLLDRDTLDLAPVAVIGLTPESARQWWADVPRTSLAAYYRPDVVQRLRAGETVLVDIEAQPLLSGADYGVRRVLIVPMRIGERIIGVFPIEHHHRETPYTEEEVALVEAIARLAALVVERERLLRERAEAQARALVMAEATRRMDEFLGIASHELRTPLTSATANVQLAARSLGAIAAAPDAASDGSASRLRRAHDLLTRTDRQMVRLDRLVGDLLDVSRIQAGKLELRPEPCDLLAIVRDAVQEQRAAWPGRDVSVDLPRGGELRLHADADRVGQVVTNLVTNALKYSANDRPVAVHVRAQGGAARVEVRDQGPGLTPEQQAHLWERFYRVPGIEQQSGSGVGLGLGLHICRTIVERHGGAVGVESAPGRGSTFWFTLPLVG